MKIEWDVPIEMDDGIVLRADIFRPDAEGRYPVILTYGPYGKGLAFQDGWKNAWDRLVTMHPNVLEGTSATYANFETVDPEKWVPDGYAIVRVDSRGAGRSPGFLDPKSVRETQGPARLHRMGRHAAVVERQGRPQRHLVLRHQPVVRRAAAAAASRRHVRVGGRVRLLPREHPSRRHPLHLRADRERFRRLADPARHGRTRPPQPGHRRTGVGSGDAVARRAEEEPHRPRASRCSRIRSTTAITATACRTGRRSRCRSCRPPTGAGSGCTRAAISKASCRRPRSRNGLRRTAQPIGHTSIRATARRCRSGSSRHFLKGEDNGWDRQPRVQLQVRHPGEKFVERHEDEWPIARTQWTKFYPAPDGSFGPDATHRAHLIGLRPDGRRPHLPDAAARARSSKSPGRSPPSCSSRPPAKTPISSWCCACSRRTARRSCSRAPTIRARRSALGWLRASHRKLDPARTLPYRPYHPHDEIEPLTPGVPVELDVEIWPTCIVVPQGYRIGFSIRGNDYRYDAPPLKVPGLWYEMTGVGPFRAQLARGPAGGRVRRDRHAALRTGTTTLRVAADHSAALTRR